MQLDVLPVSDIGGVPGEFDRNLTDNAELLGSEGSAIDADPQHEVLVIELPRLERCGLATINARPALGIQPVPPETPTQIAGINGGEAAQGVNVLDTRTDVEGIVVFLGLLVGIERLPISERPLSFTLFATWSGGSRSRGGGGPDRTCRLGGYFGGHGDP